MTKCNEIQQKFLDRDWDQAALDDAAAILRHLEQCEECRTAIGEFEQLAADCCDFPAGARAARGRALPMRPGSSAGALVA